MLQDYAIDDALRFESDEVGQSRAEIDSPVCRGQMYLYGSHVTAWQPRPEPGSDEADQAVIFMPDSWQLREGSPLFGGVPICLPWFGPHPSDPHQPLHGLVRTRRWQLQQTQRQGQDVVLTLTIDCDDLLASFTVRFGRQLSMSLTVQHQGSTARIITEALHTYLLVGDVGQIWITGLQDTDYYCKLRNAHFSQQEAELHLAGATDRVYLDSESTCHLHDPLLKRRISIAKTGSRSTVVWNPNSPHVTSHEDSAPIAWQHFVCIETANALDNAITLQPGASHTLTAQLSVEPL